MPKYRFTCSVCENQQSAIVSAKINNIVCALCNNSMHRNMPILNGPSTTSEVVDKYTGITQIDDQPLIIKDRKEDYYWSVEVPRMVNSGTYSLETMLENSWIYVDDSGKIHVNTKPLKKR